MRKAAITLALAAITSFLFAAAPLAPRKVFVEAKDEASAAAVGLVKTALAASGAATDPALVADRSAADVVVTVSAGARGILLSCSIEGGASFELVYASSLAPAAFAAAVRKDLVARLPAIPQKITEVVTELTVEETVETGTAGVDLVIRAIPGASLFLPDRKETIEADAEGVIVVRAVPQRSSVVGTLSAYGYFDLALSEYVGGEAKSIEIALERIPLLHISCSSDFLLTRIGAEYALVPGSVEVYASIDSNVAYGIFEGDILPFMRPAAGVVFSIFAPREIVRLQIGVGVFTAFDFFPSLRLSPYQSYGFELPIRLLVGSPYVSGFIQLRSSSYYGPGFATDPLPAGYFYAWPSGSPWAPENNAAGGDWYRSNFEISVGMNFAL